MYEKIALIFIVVSVIVCLCSWYAVRRVKRQLTDMADILKEVKEGNGNRRILLEIHELAAPVAYEINDIIISYEERLSAYRQMEETNKQLMTSLSHDVRTPLTTLIGYLDAVRKGLVLDKEREEYIETADKKAHDLKEYIDVLFDWFRLNSDEFVMEMETVEAAELTRDILIDWIPVFEERGITYGIEIPERAFLVRLDLDGYRRILNNLIQNIMAHAQADKVEISVSGENGIFVCRVSDNGVGIEGEDLKHIFERLYKCDKGRSKKGSGLGLSIASQLAKKMDGKLRAESREGEGTIFFLELPMIVEM